MCSVCGENATWRPLLWYYSIISLAHYLSVIQPNSKKNYSNKIVRIIFNDKKVPHDVNVITFGNKIISYDMIITQDIIK